MCHYRTINYFKELGTSETTRPAYIDHMIYDLLSVAEIFKKKRAQFTITKKLALIDKQLTKKAVITIVRVPLNGVNFKLLPRW